jgi:hypothetical protein
MSEPSEFGRGVVVCLAKFSEHLWNPAAVTVRNEIHAAAMTDAERTRQDAEARAHPTGDAAQRLASRLYSRVLDKEPDAAISQALEMWANGASDHFYELDRDRAPAALRELAELTLTMGHGFSGRRWTAKDWDRIHELWQASCLALDRQLGLKPDWGSR